MSNLPPLPPDRHVDRSKIEDYLLHPINGRGKAAFFQVYGLSLDGRTIGVQTLRADQLRAVSSTSKTG